MRHRKGSECSNGIRVQGLKQQLWDNQRISNSGTRQKPHLNIERTSEELNREAFGLEFVKRAFRISSRIQGIEDWTLWRDRSPPKWKRNCTERRSQ
jgi:hypothetical protein